MEKEEEAKTEDILGLSDPWILGRYLVLTRQSCNQIPWNINLSINAGLRLPLGKWRFDDLNLDPSFVPGNGVFSPLTGKFPVRAIEFV